MKCRGLIKVCVALVLVFATTACSSKELNIEIVKDLIVEYGDELDNSKLYDVEKSDKELKIEKVENFDTKKVGKQDIKVFFSNGDKKVEKLITVEVKDTKKPSIEVKEKSVTISKGEEFDYKSLIKKVSDLVDGELKLGKENEKNSYWLDTGKVDKNNVGDYEVYINALDINGLKADTVKLQVTVKEDNEISTNTNVNNQTSNNESNTNSGNSSSSNQISSNTNNSSNLGSSNTNNPSNQGSSNTSDPSNQSSSSTTEPPKGPKPAYGTMVLANDFPNDFPRDGWSWRYTEFWWSPSFIEWGWSEEQGKYPVKVEWQVSADSGKVQGIENNAIPFMPSKPTLEQSKNLDLESPSLGNNRYGLTNLYVCLEK